MIITVNGTARSVPDSATVDSVVVALLGSAPRAVAIALNGAVVARTSWPQQPLRPGDRLDVITALQGG